MDVIERERRNLQRASAVLAALSVAVELEEQGIDAGDVADVARQLLDGVTDALDLVQLRKTATNLQLRQPP
jgi:hypothetical protein